VHLNFEPVTSKTWLQALAMHESNERLDVDWTMLPVVNPTSSNHTPFEDIGDTKTLLNSIVPVTMTKDGAN